MTRGHGEQALSGSGGPFSAVEYLKNDGAHRESGSGAVRHKSRVPHFFWIVSLTPRVRGRMAEAASAAIRAASWSRPAVEVLVVPLDRAHDRGCAGEGHPIDALAHPRLLEYLKADREIPAPPCRKAVRLSD